jgi:hypothetical protein
MIDNYYIYIYLDPRKSGQYCYKDFCFLSEPMYIGKGKGKRYKEVGSKKRSQLFINKINKIKQSGLEPIVFKLYENLNEKQSFEIEKQLIQEIGRFNLDDGSLLNLTDGGDGISGFIFSKFSKIKMSINNTGYNNPFFGKNHSNESKNKIRLNNSRRFVKEETKLKMSISLKGKFTGIKNGSSKLKDGEVWLIKKILNSDYYKSGKITQKFIGKMFEVSQLTISAIKTGRIWSHIKLEKNNG